MKFVFVSFKILHRRRESNPRLVKFYYHVAPFAWAVFVVFPTVIPDSESAVRGGVQPP